MLRRFLAVSAVALSAVAIATSVAKPATARPGFPINIVVLNVGGEGNFPGAELRVPDTNTTVSVGDGLRRYDVHIAKMFEITHNECLDSARSGYPDPGYYWRYRAGSGDIDMGDFRISCSLARDIAIAYGLGAPERTEIYYYRVQEFVNVPTLNIVGTKVERWREFTRNFLPVRR